MKQLLCGADILTNEGTWALIKNGYLGIDGDTIAYIGTDKPEGYDEELCLNRRLIMPGLFNVHTHTPMTLLRGVGSGLPLDRWLHEQIFPIEAKLTIEDIRAGTQLALMEFLASGVVSFSDMYDFPRVTAEEVAASGMKANLNRPILAFDPGEPYESNWRATEACAFFDECYGMAGGNVLVDFAIHAEYTSLPHVLPSFANDCKERGARMHLHLSETRKEHEECKAKYKKTPARYFYDLGVFDCPTTAAHCVFVENEDIALLREKGVTAVHNPTSNMKLASGFMPLRTLLDSGVNVALGTDGAASNNNLNLFEEMHIASIIHMGYTGDPRLITPEEVLTMATQNGANAQGRTNAGVLAVGRRADLIALNMDAPHMMPVHDVPALIVYSAQASDVCLTIVNGRTLYKDGEFKTIDAERVKYNVQKAMERLF